MMVKGTNQKYVYSIALALFLGVLFIPMTIVFSGTIESHGMCAVNELPHPFIGTPPQDRRVFEAGEEVCVWLIFGGDDSTEFNLRLEWYQPDGSKMTPGSSTTRTQYYDNWKILFSETGGGIPNKRGKWTVKVFDYFSYSSRWLYDEIFTVIGDAPSTSVCPASSIYGEHSAETKLLRSIRDNVLSKTQEGQELTKLYYLWSPVIVKAMEADEEFKQEIKEIIDGVLEMNE